MIFMASFLAAAVSGGAGFARGEIESSSGNQDMHFYSYQAYRFITMRRIHRREFQIGRIHDRDAAAANNFQMVFRVDECSGVFVQTNTDRERVVGQRGQQAAETIALAKVLVDDNPIGKTESRSERHHVGAR